MRGAGPERGSHGSATHGGQPQGVPRSREGVPGRLWAPCTFDEVGRDTPTRQGDLYHRRHHRRGAVSRGRRVHENQREATMSVEDQSIFHLDEPLRLRPTDCYNVRETRDASSTLR